MSVNLFFFCYCCLLINNIFIYISTLIIPSAAITLTTSQNVKQTNIQKIMKERKDAAKSCCC